ncbi:MAG: PH domain-containing protein [Siphonobacter sp.]
MGSYVNNHLIKDEHVQYETSHHWIVFFTWSSLFTLTIAAWIRKASNEFVVTNKRIVIKTGFISRNSVELNLDKVESVDVQQTFLGRILGYGTIVVNGTGTTHTGFQYIDNPLEFRRKYQEQYDQYTQSRRSFN